MQLAAGAGVQTTPRSRRRRTGGPGDGGQRSAEIVGDGAQQRAAQLLGLHPHLGRVGLLCEQAALDGERRSG
ncbi:MAG: hypothetical protein MZV70_70195 [Desulfobacterales bacterium]|nr:hypothetical protein [Desulfobacterales bacterium]